MADRDMSSTTYPVEGVGQQPWPLHVRVAFGALALLLGAATWAWHLPMMLWDHIDLVPLYEAWRSDTLHLSELWRIHDASHFHIAAFLLLFSTTALSGGQPLLDCMASLCLLLGQAWVMLSIASRHEAGGIAGRRGLLLVFLALAPGHLANLQWGWQVAVFISTLGAVTVIALLTRPALSWGINLLALLAAVVGTLGFSTTLAVFPIAIGLIALHPGVSRPAAKWAFALPWAVACIVLVGWLASGRESSAPTLTLPDALVLAAYVMNYLGAGVSRLATAAAPVWAAVALVTATWAVVRRPKADLLPWVALMAFGMGAAALTALGRAAEFGPQHAFVTRYASFSLLFWFGWTGLMLQAARKGILSWRWCVRPLMWMLLAFLVANGVHMVKQARQLHARAVDYAADISRTYPDVPQATMDAAYDWRAPDAHRHLGHLRARGYAPFGDSSHQE